MPGMSMVRSGVWESRVHPGAALRCASQAVEGRPELRVGSTLLCWHRKPAHAHMSDRSLQQMPLGAA